MVRTICRAVALVAGLGMLGSASPAEAYWWRGRWVGPVVVVPGPAVPVFVGPPGRYWVRPHYDRFGYFVPGHWR
jgi:hypothetical protein